MILFSVSPTETSDDQDLVDNLVPGEEVPVKMKCDSAEECEILQANRVGRRGVTGFARRGVPCQNSNQICNVFLGRKREVSRNVRSLTRRDRLLNHFARSCPPGSAQTLPHCRFNGIKRSVSVRVPERGSGGKEKEDTSKLPCDPNDVSCRLGKRSVSEMIIF